MTALLLPLQLTLLVAGALAALVSGLLAWPQRRQPGGGTLLLLLLAIAEWQLASAIGATGTTLGEKLWWSQVEYVGVVSVAPLWLLFVQRHLGHRLAGRASWAWGLSVIPLATFVAAATSAHHALLWSRIEIVPMLDGVRAVFHHGPVFWFATAYNYVLLMAATWLLVRATRHAPRAIVVQRRVLLLGGAAPWAANLMYLAGIGVGRGIDPTPLAFGITGICAAIAITDLGLLELSPSRLWRSRRS